MTRTKVVFRQDAPCLHFAALGDTATRVIALRHVVDVHHLDAIIVPQPNPALIPLWTAAFGEDRIIPNTASIPERFSDARIRHPTNLDWQFGAAGWNVFETVMWENGFFQTRGQRISPPCAFPAGHQSKCVMIYPNERTDGNRVLDSRWWIETCEALFRRGWGINLLGNVDHDPLRQFYASISFNEIFPPTIEGLRQCAAASAWAIGGSTGPTWALLMSDIQQVVVETKQSAHGYWHFDRCQSILAKRYRIASPTEFQIPKANEY